MNLAHKIFSGCTLVALVLLFPGTSFGQQQGRWVRERYAQYSDRETADRVARTINQNNAAGWRNATAESSPHPVTRTYGVFADRFYPGAAQPTQQEAVVHGQLTRSDPRDRLRLHMHAKLYQFTFVAGRSYTVDLMSGNGRPGPHNPGYFDTWLRIEDAQGNIKASNDDGGDGYNSRAVFQPTQTGTYTIVVTSYASNATGSFTLRIR